MLLKQIQLTKYIFSSQPNFTEGPLNSFSTRPHILGFWTSTFIYALPNFSKHSAKSFQPVSHPPYLTTLNIKSGYSFSIFPQLISDHPSARNLLGQFSQNSPLSLMFPLIIFQPPIPIVLLRYKFPLAHILVEIEPGSICQSPFSHGFAFLHFSYPQPTLVWKQMIFFSDILSEDKQQS